MSKVKILDRESLLADEPLLRGHRIDDQTRELLSGNAFATTWWVWLWDWYADRPEELQALLSEWSPETIAYELQAEMRIQVSPQAMGRILAGREVLTSNSFYKRPWFFIHGCLGFWSGQLDPGQYTQIEDPAILAWGMTESVLLNEPDTEDEAWSAEVRGYVGTILEQSGLVDCPRAIQALMPDVMSPRQSVDWEAFPDQDPAAFEAEFGTSQIEVEDVDNEVGARLALLFEQIRSLPLQHGDSNQISQLAEKLRR